MAMARPPADGHVASTEDDATFLTSVKCADADADDGAAVPSSTNDTNPSDPLPSRVRRLGAALDDAVAGEAQRTAAALACQEAAFLRSFRAHMRGVGAEVAALRQAAADEAAAAERGDRLRALAAERDWYRREAVRLDALLEGAREEAGEAGAALGAARREAARLRGALGDALRAGALATHELGLARARAGAGASEGEAQGGADGGEGRGLVATSLGVAAALLAGGTEARAGGVGGGGAWRR